MTLLPCRQMLCAGFPSFRFVIAGMLDVRVHTLIVSSTCCKLLMRITLRRRDCLHHESRVMCHVAPAEHHNIPYHSECYSPCFHTCQGAAPLLRAVLFTPVPQNNSNAILSINKVPTTEWWASVNQWTWLTWQGA